MQYKDLKKSFNAYFHTAAFIWKITFPLLAVYFRPWGFRYLGYAYTSRSCSTYALSIDYAVQTLQTFGRGLESSHYSIVLK